VIAGRGEARRLDRRATRSGWLEVWQEGSRRSLWFDDEILQTEIDLERPQHLPNPVNRAMLSHLMFRPAPGRILLAGTGGGGIARWFAARMPTADGVAVEIEPAVADVARTWFDFPAAGAGWNLVTGDVRDYLPGAHAVDFVLVDIAEDGFSPAWVSEADFLARVDAALAPGGVMTLNLIPRDRADFATHLFNVRRQFHGRTLCQSVPAHDNVLVLGFRDRPETADLPARALAAQLAWGLEFPEFLDRMRRENPPGSGVF
jgi:spermidine synthase